MFVSIEGFIGPTKLASLTSVNGRWTATPAADDPGRWWQWIEQFLLDSEENPTVQVSMGIPFEAGAVKMIPITISGEFKWNLRQAAAAADMLDAFGNIRFFVVTDEGECLQSAKNLWVSPSWEERPMSNTWGDLLSDGKIDLIE